MTHTVISRIANEAHSFTSHHNVTAFVVANGRIVTRPQAINEAPGHNVIAIR